MGKPSENDYDLNKSLGPFCSGAFGSSEGTMSAHRVSRCPSDCMHRWMYFALPCDALLVSPPANLAAGNTNIRNKDKQNLSSKQIPAESERHVQGVLLLAQLCSHLSPMKGQPDNLKHQGLSAGSLGLPLGHSSVTWTSLISCHDGISGFTNIQMCTVSAFDPDFSCKLVLQTMQAYTDPYLPTHRFKMR